MLNSDLSKENLNNKQLLFTLFDNAPDAILIHNNEGEIKEINTTAISLFGYSESELKSMTMMEIDASLPKLSDLQKKWKRLEKERSLIYTGYYKKKGEGIFLAEAKYSQLQYDNQTLYLVYICNISDRETKLAEKFFNKLFESSNDAVFMLNRKDQFIDCNPQAEKMTGFSKKELIGKTPVDLSPKYQNGNELSKDLVPKIDDKAFEGQNLNFEWIFKKKNGIEYPVTVSLFAFKVDNQQFMYGIVRDITDKKKHEKDLIKAKEIAEENEKRLKVLSDNLPDGYVYQLIKNISTGERQFTFLSAGVKQMHNLTPEEIYKDANKLYAQVYEADIEKLIKLEEEAIQKLSTFKTIVRYKSANDQFSYRILTSNPQKTSNDEIIWNGVVLDITNYKLAEIALEESKAFNDVLLDSSPNIIYIYDIMERKNVYSNLGISKILGYTILEVKEMGAELIPFLMHKDDFQNYLNKVFPKYQLAKDNEWIEHEYRMKHKNGEWRWLYSKEMIFKRTSIGEPKQIFGVISDITEEKTINQKLIESQSRLSAFMNSANESFYLLDENFDFIEINKNALEFLNKKREDIIGKNVVDIVPDIKSFGRYDKHKEVLRTGQPFIIEDFVTHPVFGNKHFIIKSFKVNDGLGVIAIDNTERKKAELNLIKAKEKAEESDRLKSQFLNNMSHEIRTPMNGIIGFSNMLDKPNISDEKRKYYTNIVKNSSFQLLKIIDDILEISSLETKQVKLKEKEFCLNDLLMEQFAIFNLKSKEQKVPIYVKKGFHDEQSKIITDKDKLIKILSNLIENALKFTSEGFVEIGYYVENDTLVIYVKDTGIGISTKSQNIIFKRFSQESKEVSQQHGGLGLGLSISKENAQLLGGDIRVESEKGKGATFYVSIPYKPVNITSIDDARTDNKGNNNSNITILIAEDEEVNFLYLETLFEELLDDNFELIHAKDGREAVELCKNMEIDLVLMDIKMPVMNGHEATQIIKADLPELPIIAQTAYSTASDKELAIKYGCDGFISKPIEMEEFNELVGKYITKR